MTAEGNVFRKLPWRKKKKSLYTGRFIAHNDRETNFQTPVEISIFSARFLKLLERCWCIVVVEAQARQVDYSRVMRQWSTAFIGEAFLDEWWQRVDNFKRKFNVFWKKLGPSRCFRLMNNM